MNKLLVILNFNKIYIFYNFHFFKLYVIVHLKHFGDYIIFDSKYGLLLAMFTVFFKDIFN